MLEVPSNYLRCKELLTFTKLRKIRGEEYFAELMAIKAELDRLRATNTSVSSAELETYINTLISSDHSYLLVLSILDDDLYTICKAPCFIAAWDKYFITSWDNYFATLDTHKDKDIHYVNFEHLHSLDMSISNYLLNKYINTPADAPPLVRFSFLAQAVKYGGLWAITAGIEETFRHLESAHADEKKNLINLLELILDKATGTYFHIGFRLKGYSFIKLAKILKNDSYLINAIINYKIAFELEMKWGIRVPLSLTFSDSPNFFSSNKILAKKTASPPSLIAKIEHNTYCYYYPNEDRSILSLDLPHEIACLQQRLTNSFNDNSLDEQIDAEVVETVTSVMGLSDITLFAGWQPPTPNRLTRR